MGGTGAPTVRHFVVVRSAAVGDDTTSERRVRLYMAALLAVALLIRLGWGLTRPTDAAAIDALPDQREYVAIATNLLHGYGLFFLDPRFDENVYAYRTPGYPAFLAAVGADVRLARAAQALVDTSTVLAAYLLARRWLGRVSSAVAATLVALNPFLVYFSGLILTETLFTAMLAWGMVMLVPPPHVPPRRGHPLVWLAGVCLLGLSVLVRPGAVGIPVVLAILSAFVNRRDSEPYHRWRLPVGATSLLLTVLILLPWAYRNHRVVGRWVWTTTNGGITAYDGFNPDADGSSDQSFVKSMPQLASMGEVGRSDYLAAKARQYARENPARVVELVARKVARTWSPVPLSAEFGSRPIYVVAALLFAGPFYVLVILGVLRSTLPRSAKVFLLAPAIYLTVAHAVSVGSLRYRIPAEVPMAVVAAAGCRPTVDRSWRRAGGPGEELHPHG